MADDTPCIRERIPVEKHAVAAVPAEPVVVVDPTMITVAHWGRLDDGELFARARYVEWAVMLHFACGFITWRAAGLLR